MAATISLVVVGCNLRSAVHLGDELIGHAPHTDLPAEVQLPTIAKAMDRGGGAVIKSAIAKDVLPRSEGDAKWILEIVEEQAGELFKEAICVGMAQIKDLPSDTDTASSNEWKRFLIKYVTDVAKARALSIVDSTTIASRADALVTALELDQVNPAYARTYFQACGFYFPSMRAAG